MRPRPRHVAVVVVGALAAAGIAQDQAYSALDRKAIQRGRKVLVSQLDPKLPPVTLESFVQAQAGRGSRITWEANDCGEQTGSPADAGRDFPLCAEANALLEDGRTIVVRVGVGTLKKGVFGAADLWWVAVNPLDSFDGAPLKRLSDLPAELAKTKTSAHGGEPKREEPSAAQEAKPARAHEAKPAEVHETDPAEAHQAKPPEAHETKPPEADEMKRKP
jgi:hypothetical protein